MKKTGLYMASTALVAVLLGGCATVLEGSIKQTDIKIVGSEKARCVIYNDDYKYLVNAPAKVPLERSHKDLTADCYGENGKHRVVTIPSMGSSAAAVNALNGVVPGVAVDVTSGAAFTFPNEIVIDFDREPNALARAQAYRKNRPQWPNNMVDGMYVQLPPEPEVVEPQVVYVEVTPPEEPIEPMKAIELLHKKMNHIPGDEAAATGAQITEASGKPVVVVVEGADAVVVPVEPAATAKMAPIVEGGAERTMAEQRAVTPQEPEAAVEPEAAPEAAPAEAPVATPEATSSETPAEQSAVTPTATDADAAPAGNTASVEPVTPVGESFTATAPEINNPQPIHNVQMDPVMDEPAEPKSEPKAEAKPAAEVKADKGATDEAPATPAESEQTPPPLEGAAKAMTEPKTAPVIVEDPADIDNSMNPDMDTAPTDFPSDPIMDPGAEMPSDEDQGQVTP